MPTSGFKRLMRHWSSLNYFIRDDEQIQEPSKSKKGEKLINEPANVQADSTSAETLASMMPMLHLIKSIYKLVGFILLRFLCLIFITIYDILNGSYFEALQSRKAENYHRSARVMNIVMRYKFDVLVNLNGKSDFILTHSCFDHPRCVMADEVSLYAVNEKEAIFVEAPPGVHVWRSKCGSFHNVGQLKYAQRVIVMPIESFNKLAEEVGDPKGNLVFITNTARCGSTLLSRIFEETDEFVTLSEPTAINYIRKFIHRSDDLHAQYHCRNVIRMLCKPTREKNYVVKITPNSTKIVPLLRKLYPNASHLFNYRDGFPVSKSMFKIWVELPMGYLNVSFARYFQWFYVLVLNISDYYDYLDNSKEKLNLSAGYGQACFYWGNVIGMYRRFIRAGIPMAGVKYEDLVKDKEFAVRQMFEYCGIVESLVKPALRAFQSDAQKNSNLNMKNLKQKSTILPEFSEDDKRNTDKICDYFGLARLGDSCVLGGTLTRERIPCPLRKAEA